MNVKVRMSQYWGIWLKSVRRFDLCNAFPIWIYRLYQC